MTIPDGGLCIPEDFFDDDDDDDDDDGDDDDDDDDDYDDDEEQYQISVAILSRLQVILVVHM